jgi:protein-disulfide isomerase
MSRAYNAKRKAKRQQARASAAPEPHARRAWPRRLTTIVPVLIIAVILAVVGILGFGPGSGVSKNRVDREVTELLNGIPQHGSVLGSPKAPITLRLYADLECPTVRMFVENYLPAVIDTWVRTGVVKLDYRSLETDTSDEEVFFKQETAALAAGRQNKMWSFALTFVQEQGEPQSNYVTDPFLVDIASQVPGLGLARWRSDRADALLSKRVALGVYSGHQNGLRSTPSFLIGFTSGKVHGRADTASTRKEVEASVESELKSVEKEASEDFPTLKSIGPNLVGG